LVDRAHLVRRAALALGAALGAALGGAAFAAEPAPCTPLEVAVAQSRPTEAVLRWRARPGALAYFVTYSTGKFPTQTPVVLPADGGDATAALIDLRPGRTYDIAVCEALTAGGCPGGAPELACVTTVKVAAITAAPDAVQPDKDRAQCAIQAGVALTGEYIGYPFEEPVEATSVEACCELCATTEPRLPYVKQCTAFVFYAESQSCGLLAGWSDSKAVEGRSSGLVTAWPKAQP
jgi:hypothetical protein